MQSMPACGGPMVFRVCYESLATPMMRCAAAMLSSRFHPQCAAVAKGCNMSNDESNFVKVPPPKILALECLRVGGDVCPDFVKIWRR